MELFKDFKRTFNIISLGYILLGLFLLLKPETSLLTISYVFAVLTLIYGIIHLIIYFIKDSMVSVFRYDFVIGIVAVLFGIYIFISPKTIIAILPVAFGIFIILSSIVKFQNALDLKRMYYDRWWLVLAFAVVCTLLGLLLIMRPLWLMKVIMRYVGVILIIDGAMSLYSAFCVSRNVKRVRRDLKRGLKGRGYGRDDVEVIDEDDITIE